MDYIDHAIKQLENQNTISGTFAREQYNALKASQMPTEWRKEAPTDDGVYLVKQNHNSHPVFVELVFGRPFGPSVFMFGCDSPFDLSDFYEWLGPFPMEPTA